jgi:hypothetical protein
MGRQRRLRVLGLCSGREACRRRANPPLGAKPIVVGASLGGIASLLAEGGCERSNGTNIFSALVLVDITPRVDVTGVNKVLGFMRARAKEGFATIADAAQAVAEYLPHRPRPKSHEGLKKNLRLSADGRWRWHWDPRFLDGPRAAGVDRVPRCDGY